MKFEIQQEELQKALDIVANVVPAKTTMPILTCLLMEVSEGLLIISATNLDISITTKIAKVVVSESGKVAIPAVKFVPFVRSLRSGTVKISQKGEQITLVSGKSRLMENTMNVDDFPKLKELEKTNGFDVEANQLIDMINETSYSISRDETRPALMGILWEVRPDSLTLVATDAHRLARSSRDMDWAVSDERNMIVDTAGLRHISRITAATKDDDTVSGNLTIYVGKNQLSFQYGDSVLHTRLLEGPFPEYSAVIPTGNDKNVTVDKTDFIQAIRRVAITADRVTSQIKLGIESGRMELAARGTGGSQADDEISVAYEGDAVEIGFNYTYLQDILKNIKSDSIVLSLQNTETAALIKPIDEEGKEMGVLCLLMPLRLAGD